jgi:MFS family permease
MMTDAIAFRQSRGFRIVFIAQAVSIAGDYITPVALAFAVLDVTSSATALGVALGARALPGVFFMLPAGIVADRFGRHTVMAASHLCRCATQVALGGLIVTGHASLTAIVVLQLITGTAASFFRPASNSIMPSVVADPRDLQKANGAIEAVRGALSVIGPATAGVLVLTVGPGWAILCDGLTFAVAGVLLMRLRLARPRRATGSPTTLRADFGQGWGVVRQHAWMSTEIWYNSLFNLLCAPALSVLGPIVAKTELGGAGSWAIIVAAGGAGACGAGVVALRRSPQRPLLAAFAIMAATVPHLACLALVAPLWVLVLSSGVSGFGLVAAGIWTTTTIQRLVDPSALSRVTAYSSFGAVSLYPLGLALIGPVAEVLGTRAALTAVALATLALTAVAALAPAVRQVREPLSPVLIARED